MWKREENGTEEIMQCGNRRDGQSREREIMRKDRIIGYMCLFVSDHAKGYSKLVCVRKTIKEREKESKTFVLRTKKKNDFFFKSFIFIWIFILFI